MLSETELKSLIDSKVNQLTDKDDLISITYCKPPSFVSL